MSDAREAVQQRAIDRGQRWPAGEPLPSLGPWEECWTNAWRAAVERDWLYCEGVVAADPFGTGLAWYAHAFVVSPDGLAHETTTGWETAEAYFGFVIDRAQVPDFGPGPRSGVLEAATAAAVQSYGGTWGQAAALAVHRMTVRA